MFDAVRAVTDRWLGRGSAAITVPVMDGKLKPNRVLDQAEQLASLEGIDDLASDGKTLWASAGAVLFRLVGNVMVEVRRFDGDITAIAVRQSGRMAVAVAGRQVRVFDVDGLQAAMLDSLAGRALRCVNALAFESDGTLLVSDGSKRRGPEQWCHDLMELGSSGRVARWSFSAGKLDLLAENLGFVFGVLPMTGAVLVSESWRHRVRSLGSGASLPLLADLPCYPSRMAAAKAGGFWLSCFVCRTQLVEFVLREPSYRQRMMAEIDPRYWIAPALSSGRSFMEPLQGAGVKQMGVLKPWAPPRSYGLILRVAEDGRILRSLHSQVDGQNHGITAVAEHDGFLYVVSKGSGRLLRVTMEVGE